MQLLTCIPAKGPEGSSFLHFAQLCDASYFDPLDDEDIAGVIKAGTGKKPESARATVKVHYTGKFIDGTTFDSSVGGSPIEFPLNRVIPGWTEGLQLMREGEKAELVIPYKLGYGEEGSAGAIPPYQTLVFEVELISVK